MSEEEKELLARIGQLAGQINRHKNQQTAPRPVESHHPGHNRHNTYRHANAPYPSRGSRGALRGGRPPAHHHRTLNLNAAGGPNNSGSSRNGSETPPGWVTRNDRHRQLINANVYEKESQNRTKAIEETRQRRLNGHRQREKTQFNEFLKHQAVASNAPTNPAGRNEIVIEGIQFCVVEGGKKLVKLSGVYQPQKIRDFRHALHDPDPLNSSFHTPKNAVVAGVKFHRTKTGNLVADRIVNDQRRSGVVKKVNEPCKMFSTTGNFFFHGWSHTKTDELDEPGSGWNSTNNPYLGTCLKGPRCRFMHDPNKVALCKEYLKEGHCANGESCDLSHDVTPERVPNCVHFAKGYCTKSDCPYTHSKASPGALVCRAFGFNGYCEKGADCTERHVFECPDFSNTGSCKVKGCKLLHRERASVLRHQAKTDETMEDVSSEDEAADSDDVDSDEVAEFIDADSDGSDFEDHKDFISL
ncbi:hypothetical protein AK830_g11709 [Neonectria ditissima]|uniref:C3H1-type domain-containing protein n=1 Tax=Neonectria ditissima TaxID=78410 RepID=A0A0P7B263_9HYPO|nr:hypothetical protein AK830_g11709 [Neonectria ditissima]